MNQSLKQIILIVFTFGILNGQSQIEGNVDSSSVKSPGKALLFSVIPGGGQLYNRHPLKAILFAGAFAYYGYGYSIAQQDYQADLSSESLHRTRNDKVWMMSLIWTLNIIDAYVDAQLWDFGKYEIEDQQEITDENMIKPKEAGPIDDTE
ncbi:MAG: hypothetical protein HN995_08210 [Candidatus Marinimicrobia bacterium]|jgi:hypothetical protein|nr:hypothetical protein [Candidatus Neomarinimicrobiota bacterium]MBT3574844.1 hypothetical protein [Candidatus Neomarinimicrobiota bacterium]MBT3679323.1 hypothetical protein [Candidatus Neomarinimicrobiota bacterium]MBT3951550.1 hypothetical protein [Candidatus Neomarinimicrobiota bacterium]MBT4252467.1 hypothetical protein [Candidatus Neomarinimicrobiota bacterium]